MYEDQSNRWPMAAGKTSGAPIQLISRREVERLTSLKHSTLYALIHVGEFPIPIKVTPRRSAWVLAEVASWIEQRALNNRAHSICTLAGGERVL